jgi:splicing factor U2AF subunit
LEYNKQLMSDLGNDGDLDNILKKIAAIGAENGIEAHIFEERIICPPSRVLILKHIVTLEELSIDEEYNEIIADVKEMAERMGHVISITIPRYFTILFRPYSTGFDLESAPRRVKGLGYVFIEYENAEIAKKARKQFVTKMFSGRSVACGYFDPERYKAGELDINEKVIINF